MPRRRIHLLVASLLAGCGGPAAPPPSAEPPAAPAFTERAAEWGLDFEHWNGRAGNRYMVEVLAPGVALLDYDGDGDLDVFLVQGSRLGPELSLAEATAAPPGGEPLTDRLFRNDLTAGQPRFVDVTREAGLDSSRGYGMGVATGDFDHNGAVDLYITRFGRHQLWRNRGDGRFEDATAAAGLTEERFGSSATFFDFDDDGWLDLFVGLYVDFSYSNHRTCFGPGGATDYCGPATFHALPSRLWRNVGGRFVDVTASSGVATAYGPALGVIAGDWNSDGRRDLYVANDGAANQLWINQGGGVFRDEALISGCAVNAAGAAEAGMGVDAGDFDGDGDFDFFLTHLTGETNTLYTQEAAGAYADASRSSELGPPSFPFTGFGTRFFDYNHDGWPDLLVANGSIKDLPELVERGDPFPLHQTNQLFRNRGDGRFEEVSGTAGKAFEVSEVSRGAAMGDLDGDGDVDVALTNNGGPARLLINEVGAATPWLGVEVTGQGSAAPFLGAVVWLRDAGGRRKVSRVASDGSYLSASDARVVFGLGDEPAASYGLDIDARPAKRLRLEGLKAGFTYVVPR